MSRKNTKEDVWKRIRVGAEDECWEWQASTNGDGYGRMKVVGRLIQAHRLVFEITKGQIPDGQGVCHTCDNPLCCNPDHLFVGTNGDNNRDRSEKGRTALLVGETNPSAKLTEAEVSRIRDLYSEGMSQGEIARRFGVTDKNIGQIVRNQTWRHVK